MLFQINNLFTSDPFINNSLESVCHHVDIEEIYFRLFLRLSVTLKTPSKRVKRSD